MDEQEMMVLNQVYSLQRATLARMMSEGRDYDTECGYPSAISFADYWRAYKRDSVGKRIVRLFPMESWKNDPEIFETEDPDETAWETEWKTLQENLSVFSQLKNVDILSGIGRYGGVFLGFADGKNWNEPVDGVETGSPGQGGELLYLRSLTEGQLSIKSVNKDSATPRYDLPELYEVRFAEDDVHMVHWTRILHVADEAESSPIYGTPRMEVVWDRLIDLRKVLGGSGEMFWRGAFPGLGLEVNPEFTNAVVDKEAVRAEMAKYAEGLQRYIALTGMSVKSLAVQVADPSNHVGVQFKAISIALGIPVRKLIGTEEARLSSTQDEDTWNGRLASRQLEYLTPSIVRPFIDRCIQAGVLSEPAGGDYTVHWPDLSDQNPREKADTTDKLTQAFAKYVAGDVDMLISPADYLTQIVGMNPDQVTQIMEGVVMRMREEETEEDVDEMDEMDEEVEE